MQSFGDSITFGVGASPSSKSWLNLFAPINYAVSGNQAAEVANSVQNAVPQDVSTFMVGTNDAIGYKGNPAKKKYFEKFLRSAIAFIALPNKLLAKDMVQTGTWTNTSVNSFGKYTTQSDASLAASFTGCKVYVSYIIQNNIAALSVADVLIDGVKVGEISCDGYTVPMSTRKGLHYASACEVFETTDGCHELQIVAKTSGKNVYINWIAAPQPSPKILVSNVMKFTQAAYNEYGASEQIINDYNEIIDQVADELNCIKVDNYSTINPDVHLMDGVHPNNLGHAIIHENFKQAINSN